MYTSDDLLHNILSLGSWSTWKRGIEHVEEGINAWKDAFPEKNYQHVYFVGCGSSFYSGQIGKFFIESIAKLPSEARQAFSFTHYSNPELFNENTLVVGISTTGNTSATLDALSFANQSGAVTLAITADRDSKITEIADFSIFTGGPVTVIVKTFEYIQALTALYILAFYLGNKEHRTSEESRIYYSNQLFLAYSITKRFFDQEQDKIIDLVNKYHNSDIFFVLGSGINVGTAEEAALKLIEMAKVYADGYEMEDFFHGRDREITNKSPMFFLEPQNRDVKSMLNFLKFNQMVEVPSILLTRHYKPEYKDLADNVIFLGGDLDAILSPLVYITPLYVFSYYLALKRGFLPLERRYYVGALNVKYKNYD